MIRCGLALDHRVAHLAELHDPAGSLAVIVTVATVGVPRMAPPVAVERVP